MCDSIEAGFRMQGRQGWFVECGQMELSIDKGLQTHRTQPDVVSANQQKKKVTPRRASCSLWVGQSRCIERKLAFWVCGLLLDACGQRSMPPGRTRRNQGLSRYAKQKGSPDTERFFGRKKVLRMQPNRVVE